MSTALGYGKRELIEKIVQENWKVSPFKKMFNYNEVLFIIQEMLNEEGKFYFTRRKGLSGHHVFREFVKLLMYRNLANYDSMVLITADKGVGKSSAAMMIAREWCRMQGRVFDPKRHIAYNNSDVMQKIDMLDKYEPIICVSGNTKIRIKRNNVEHSVMIKNLVGKNNYDVLSYNIKENKFEYQKPKEVILTKKAITWVVELENGIKLRATPEHLFLTKNRGYVQLKNLNNDDEIVLQSRNCKICGKEFFNKRWGTLTCSKKCSDINIEIQIPYRIKYSEKSKKWYSKYHNEKIKNNINYRLKHNLMTRIVPFIKGKIKTNKNEDRVTKTIGCNIKQLYDHLEKQFKNGMNWNNYGFGKNKWSIDHIKPLLLYKKSNDDEEKRKLLHYTNIQPLWNNENSRKGRWTH